MAIFDRCWRAYGKFLYGCAVLAGIMMFLMMLLVVANALGRYGFNRPIDGAFEITESLLCCSIFLSLALAQYEDRHIRVVLLTRHFPQPLQRLASIFASVLGLVFFCWCSFAAWGSAMTAYNVGEQEWGALRYPIFPIKFLIFGGLVLLSIQFALGVVRAATVDPKAIESCTNGETQ